MNQRIIPLLLAAAVLAGCNKDDVIEPQLPIDNGGNKPGINNQSPYQNRVYAYMPAPGQFINETATGGFTGNETTQEAANEFAYRRLSEQKFVSLGSFGGFIVVGFDHNIINSKGDYDLAILGNAMTTSNEPGIVWVMQDKNKNGLPDDQWYELRGSETGKPETIQGYAVTYYRPSAPKMATEWTDSEGNSGTVDYLKAYHKQDYYYPAWVEADSYTLIGTRLEARNVLDTQTGNWANEPYSWGYVDNIGSDALPTNKQWTGFKISNAMNADGTPAELDYINFVKVQHGVLAKSGWLGENSCEVFSIADYSMLPK